MKVIKILTCMICLLLFKNVYAVEANDYMLKKFDVVPNVYVTKISDSHKIYDYMYIIARKSDHKHIYCIEPGIHIDSEALYNGYIDNALEESKLTLEQLNKIKVIAYYGYGYKDDSLNIDHTDKKWYAVTQFLIWEIESNNHEIYFTKYLQGPKADLFSNEINELRSLVNMDLLMPDFENIRDLSINESVELYDKNNVLNLFDISSSSNVIVKKANNKLKITAKSIGPVKIKFIKKYSYYDEKPMVYTYSTKTQRLFSVGNLDNKELELNFNVNAGRIKIIKIDDEMNQLINDATLENAIYGVYDANNNLIAKLFTNRKGEAISDYLPYGKYLIKELVPSKGYVLDKKEYELVINNNEVYKVISKEKIITKNVILYKSYGSLNAQILEAEKDVIFDIYLKQTNEYLSSVITDEKGFASVDLPYGTWIFKQRNTIDGYAKADDFEITINNYNINKTIIDNVIRSKIKIIKVDSKSKNIIKRNGLKFKIKNLDNKEYICENENCIFESTDGVVVTNNYYEFGNYQIEEIYSDNLSGYVLNNDLVSFSINEDNVLIDDKMIPTVEISFSNEQVFGTLEINKTGEKIIIDNGSFYYENVLLDNVEFNLIANEDIYSQDGSLVYSNQDKVLSFSTVNGYYKLFKLYLGNYCLIETKTENNHILDNNPICFEIKYQDAYTSEVKKSIDIDNYLKKGNVELIKADNNTMKPLSDSLIEFYTLNDELIYKGYTDSNGRILIKDLAIGKYKYVERKAPEGYILDNDFHYFEIKESDEIVKEVLFNEKDSDLIVDIVEVPNTWHNKNCLLLITNLIMFLIGFGLIIYEKKKNI